jgi:hypothetical protein
MIAVMTPWANKLQLGLGSMLLVGMGVVIGLFLAPLSIGPPPPVDKASQPAAATATAQRRRQQQQQSSEGDGQQQLFPSPNRTDDAVVDSDQPIHEGLTLYAPSALDSGYAACIATATDTLFAMMGLADGAESDAYAALPWLLQPSGATSFLWSCRSEDRGIMLCTSVTVRSAAPAVLRWLMDRNIVSGLEAIAYENVLIRGFCGGSVGVRRICCDTGSLTSAKRDFVVMTSVTARDDGDIVVASRSVHVPDRLLTAPPRRSKQGHIRGVVHASGFVLRPRRPRAGDGPGECEVLFGAHVDLLSPAAGHTHRSTLEELTASALTILERLEEFFRLSGNGGDVPRPVAALRAPAPSMDPLPPPCACPNLLLLNVPPTFPAATAVDARSGGPHVTLTVEHAVNLQSAGSSAVARIRHLHESLTSQVAASASGDEAQSMSSMVTPAKASRTSVESAGLLPVSVLGALGLRVASPSPASPTSDIKNSLRSLSSMSADHGLRSFSSASSSVGYGGGASSSSFGGGNGGGDGDGDVGRTGSTDSAHASASSTGTGAGTYSGAPPGVAGHRGWDTFYAHDGVDVAELPGGVYSARCTVAASPGDVRNVLMKYPERVDGLSARRTVLNRLDDDTVLQWVGFGPVWPVGSKDFLVVTTEESATDFQDSFVVAFTSVDELCEDIAGIDAAVEAAVAAAAPSHGVNGSVASYQRSTVRCAGFIGVPDGVGGTVLTMFVDADVCEEPPAWLMRLLAQYELCEMMRRVRAIPVALNSAHSSATDLRKLAGAAVLGGDAGLGHAVTPVVEYEPVTYKHTGDFFAAEGAALAVDAVQTMKAYVGIDAPTAVEWQPATTVDGVAVATGVVVGSTDRSVLVRATLAVDAERDALVSLLTNDRRLCEYDLHVDAVEPLVCVDGRTAVRRMRCKPVWPTAPRDFVVLTTWAASGDGSALVCTRSAPNDVFPPEPGYVRGTVHVSGYHVQPKATGGCHVTLVAHMAFGGSVPASILATLTTAAPAKTLHAIAALAREVGVGAARPAAPATSEGAGAGAAQASAAGAHGTAVHTAPATPAPAAKAADAGDDSAFFLRRSQPDRPEPPAAATSSAAAASPPGGATSSPPTSPPAAAAPDNYSAGEAAAAVVEPAPADIPDPARPFVAESAAVAAAAVALMKVYLGLEAEPPGTEPLRLDWQQRAADKGIVAYTTMVPGRWGPVRPDPFFPATFLVWHSQKHPLFSVLQLVAGDSRDDRGRCRQRHRHEAAAGRWAYRGVRRHVRPHHAVGPGGSFISCFCSVPLLGA